MAEIHKIKEAGKLIYPATVTSAVLDPDSGRSLADILGSDVVVNFTADQTAVKVGTATHVNYSWTVVRAGEDITTDCTYNFEGVAQGGNSKAETLNPTTEGEIVRNLEVSYKGRKYTAQVSIFASYPTYFGAMSKAWEFNETNIKLLSCCLLVGSKEMVDPKVTLKAQRYVYAYPKSLGDLSSIKDVNGFEYYYEGWEGSGFKKTEVTVDSVPYNVYYLDEICTISSPNYKYIFS